MAGDHAIAPEQLGAIGDGIADDSDPLEQALGLPSAVYLPGKYRITRSIAVTAPPGGVTWEGAGRRSQIILDAPDILVSVTLSDIANPWGATSQQATLKNFCLVPASTSVNPALLIAAAPASGSAEPVIDVDAVHVIPDTTAHYTACAIQLHDVRNGRVRGCQWNGSYGTYPHLASSGALVISNSAYPPARSNPVDIHVSDCQATWFKKGIWLLGFGSSDPVNNPSDWQGILIRDSSFLACETGVYAQSGDGFSGHLQISGCHFNIYSTAIYAPNIWQPHYSHNNIMFFGSNASVVGIDASANGQSWPMFGHILGNFMNFNRSPAIGSAIGIKTGSAGSPNGGCYTVIENNMMWKGSCASLTKVQSVGGTIYEQDNGMPTNRAPI